MMRPIVCAVAAALLASPAAADPANFTKGPVITQGGGVARIAQDLPLPAGRDWKMAFDVSSSAAGKLNPHIDAAARYINMLAASGVPQAKIKAVLVFHGGGMMDLLTAANYARETDGQANPNTALLQELLARGVPIYVCGQSAELLDVKKDEMIPGIQMALSAMTAHETLQAEGYAVKPF